jgi:hypothetical protein
VNEGTAIDDDAVAQLLSGSARKQELIRIHFFRFFLSLTLAWFSLLLLLLDDDMFLLSQQLHNPKKRDVGSSPSTFLSSLPQDAH